MEIFYTCFRVTNKDETPLVRRVNALLLYESNECCLSFRFVFLQFLLPCLINASLSVCVWVCTISIVSSLNKVMASVMRRVSSTQIDCPNNSHTHTHTCVCESRVRIFGTMAHQWECECDGETLDRFFRSFLRVCVCEERAVVFAFRFCVCVCREESFALQLLGAIHSNLVSFEIKKINKK